MCYRDRLRRDLPIGSGQIEGVCKNTLNRRLRLNNPRGRPEHAQNMTALCCLHASHPWEAYCTPGGMNCRKNCRKIGRHPFGKTRIM